MIPTDTPSSAAARAARCPARPAPITRTSCWGISGSPWVYGPRPSARHAPAGVGRPARAAVYVLPAAARSGGGPQGALYVAEGHHPAEHSVAIDRHHRPQAAQPLAAVEELLERLADPDPERPRGVAGHHRLDRSSRSPFLTDGLDLAARHQTQQAAGAIDDREPRPAVAEEELLVGLLERGVGPDRDRLGVHHIGHAHALDPRRHLRLEHRA